MISEIRMPQFGVTMESGTVSQWNKQVGDTVHTGDVLLSIETEKLTNDVVSEADGILLAIVAQEGEDVPVQGLLGVIGAEGDTWTQPGASEPVAAPVPAAQSAAAAAAAPAGKLSDGRIKVSPLAKKVAEELGVDLTKVQSTGTTGRIKAKDVRRYYEQLQQAAQKASAPAEVQEDVRERMSAARRVIARRMTESVNTAPQVTLTREICADRLVELHQSIKKAEKERKVSINDLLIKLLAAACASEPVLNVSVDGEDLIRHSHINVGVAVALPDGLLVPVVRDADRKGAFAIAEETHQLIAQAREGRLSPDALTGGTITISNLGSFEVEGFSPIVNLPEAAIMGIGRIVRKAIVEEDGSFRAANMMTASLTFDHRAADGATAARLLKKFAQLVENPAWTLM